LEKDRNRFRKGKGTRLVVGAFITKRRTEEMRLDRFYSKMEMEAFDDGVGSVEGGLPRTRLRWGILDLGTRFFL
jgi:hypothetical protein